MNDKVEHWRNQTLVNRTRSNAMIATEYYTLIKYLVENYKERMETIQNPLLYLFSHCMELTYKEINLYALNHSYINGNIEKTIHGHDLRKLSSMFVKLCRKLSQENCCSDEDKKIIDKIIPNHIKLCETLATTTTTYRYIAKYDNNGNIKGKSVPFQNDNESPNIQELYPLFESCYFSASRVLEILENFLQCPI